MHFSQAVSVIQSQIGVIKGVHVLYSEMVRFYLLILVLISVHMHLLAMEYDSVLCL